MNELVIPPSPLWYKSAAVACAPDNTLIYGSKSDIVIVKERGPEEAAEVKLIHLAHSKSIISISLNMNWKEPHAYVASFGEEGALKVWDVATLEKKFVNTAHSEHKEGVVGAVFAGDDRIVSAATSGLVIVWNITTNESKPLKNIFGEKVAITCLSSCPHKGWLVAFGLNNGCVIIADVRRNGNKLYHLRGHYQAVVSLSWCPAPINIFPRCVRNAVKNKSDESIALAEAEKTKKANPWVNLVHADDGEVPPESSDSCPVKLNDFLKDCDNLKSRILGLVAPNDPEKSDINAEKSDVDPEKSDINPEKSDVDPEKSDINAEKSDVDHEKSDTDSEKSDVDPEKSDVDPEKSGVDPEKSDIDPEKSDINPEKSDVGPEKSDTDPEKSDTDPEKSDLPEKSDVPEKSDLTSSAKEPKISYGDFLNNSEPRILQRPLPRLYDPSGDFLDDTAPDEEIFEDKDTGDEKTKNTKEDTPIETGEDPKTEEQNIESSTQPAVEKNSSDVSGEVRNSEEASPETFAQPVIEEEPRNEYLLASAGKDQKIYIWRAGTDGRLQTMFQSPKRSKYKDSKNAQWICLCWISPDRILTTTTFGEVLEWALPKPKEANKQFKMIHHEHTGIVFNIVTPPKYVSAYNWRDHNDSSIWTWGQDGRLINYDIKNRKVLLFYETITATITCFDASSLDPNRLAIGVRDGSIRVWDLSLPHSKTITMHKYHHKVTQKVSTIAWNPKNEMILGFGTEEGRVGYVETSSKKSSLFNHFFRTQVYKVQWGPISGTPDFGLYALAEGKIVIYNIAKVKEDPIQLDLPEELYVYKFAWKPDFSLLLLNGKDGSLVGLTTEYSALNTVYLNDKGLNSIVWHPDSSSNNTTEFPRCNWLAATTSKGVVVYDCNLLKDATASGENLMDRIIVTFEGHVRPPLAVAWCPFEGNRLVSTAPDGLIHVWDVVTKSAISTLIDPYFFYNQAVIWSPLDPDLVIVGDKIVRVWSISANPPKIDEEFLAERKNMVAKAIKTESEKTEKMKIKVELPKVKGGPKNSVVPSFYVSNDENLELQVSSMQRVMVNEFDKTDPLQLFGGKEQVSNLLTVHHDQQKKEGKFKSCELISLWKGNIADYIIDAINENRVTPSVVTLAPMVSLKLWQDCCESYAKKLLESANSDPLETAMYFLACHKLDDAINCLCLNLMFKEALALAKERLPSNSDVINDVTKKWAEHCVNTGNFETAAYCYIATGEYAKAAKVLARRNNRQFLEFAAELAEKMEDKALSDSIKFKINELQADSEESHNNEQIGDEEVLPSRVEAICEMVTKNANSNESDEGECIEAEVN